MGFSSYRRLTELESDVQQMRAEHDELERRASLYEQALLRISEPGSDDTVESLAEFAAETLIGVTHDA